MSSYEKDTISRGELLVKNLAQESVLSILYDSPENINDKLDDLLSLADVVEAQIFHTDRTFFHGKSKLTEKVFELNLENTPKYSEIYSFKIDNFWHFICPVVINKQNPDKSYLNILYETNDNYPSELLGYSHVSLDIGPTRNLLYGIFLTNLMVAILVAGLFVAFANLGLKRIIQPLYSLAGSMRGKSYFTSEGPKEITRIGSVYNAMMKEIAEYDEERREYQNKLEAEVKVQTKELVIARDLALSASKSKSEFIANTSHELKTPLQSIIGYASLIKEELFLADQESDLPDYVEIIERDANKLLAQINSMLDLATIESGNMKIKTEITSLLEILNEVSDMIAPLIERKRNVLTRNNDESFNVRIRADKGKIIQILTNLLSNANKFTSGGSIKVNAFIKKKTMYFFVSDTGIGIDPKMQEYIFDAFKQVDGSHTRIFEGTGLGLAISKKLCNLLGGDISVTSVLGEGAVFQVNLPVDRV